MRQLFLLLVVGVALVVLWAQHVTLLTSVGRLVVEETPLGPADVVFALGQTPGIAEEAAAIVRAGHAPRVVLFTSPSNEGEEVLTRLGVEVPRPHEVVVKVLRAAGVAAQRITVIPHDPDGTN